MIVALSWIHVNIMYFVITVQLHKKNVPAAIKKKSLW